MTRHLLVSLTLITVVLTAGCGDDPNHDHDEHDTLSAEDEACTHAQDSPTTRNAAAEITGIDADVSQPHTLYEISLVETEAGSGAYEGYLSYQAAEHADYLFFTSHAIELSVLDEADIALETTLSEVEACVELARSHRVSLEAQRYVIKLGPSSESTLSLIIESEAHDHDHP